MANDDRKASKLSRRQFLGGAAGMTFAVSVGPRGGWLVADALADGELALGVWVRITPDDRVTIVTPAAEMGQGSMTAVSP